MMGLKVWWRSVYEWLTRQEPVYPQAVNLSKDRSLHGKARRKARRS